MMLMTKGSRTGTADPLARSLKDLSKDQDLDQDQDWTRTGPGLDQDWTSTGRGLDQDHMDVINIYIYIYIYTHRNR